MADTLRKDIEQAINRHSAESGSDTPDFILAEYLEHCLQAFDNATRLRERWYGAGDETDPGDDDGDHTSALESVYGPSE